MLEGVALDPLHHLHIDVQIPLALYARLVVIAAWGQLQAALLSLGSIATQALAIVPAWERARPILEARPEADETREDPGELGGEVEAERLRFRYEHDAPFALDDLSFRAARGEFVAFVGPSDAGKSTIFRLLLGFVSPEGGEVFYDGRALSGLDPRAVRRQIGVVLQNGRLVPGSILSNIAGGATLTEEEAWEAARLSGLEKDPRQMPMGMHTFVSEGAATFSGGQRQRLLIARAVALKPKILLFDEATSALDNRTQENVSEGLASLHTTRIVIAHRLSTVRSADRIHVLDAGRIVETGRYEELLARDGLFAALARRQLA